MWLGCSKPEPAEPRASRGEAHPIFVDRAAELGVDFQHESGATGKLYMPETTGSGVALFDFDHDGDLDIYLVQGGSLEEESGSTDQIYRNDLAADETWQFVEITETSRIHAIEYGQGVAIGDVDNDGYEDIFLANFGRDQIWLNNGDGSFQQGAEQTGLGDRAWASSAVFFDYDNDGWLDLFVARYLQYSIASHKDCFFTTGSPDYCKPGSYTPLTDLLYRNSGTGEFDVVAETEIASSRSNGLGVIAADLGQDGWTDLYVANDQMINFLWINRNGEEFENQALVAGVALNSEGMAEASMGVLAVDLDNDGLQDLFMTHLDGETNTFYRNLGKGLFEDRTRPIGLASPSLLRTSFGVAAIDFDNDGDLDIATTTGAVHIDLVQLRSGEPLPLKQQDQLFENDGGQFADITNLAGADFGEPGVGRGLAAGDLDNDGDRDLVLNNAHGRARVFINQRNSGSNWIGFRVERLPGVFATEGTRLELRSADGSRRTAWVQRGGSFLSSNDPRNQFGLGDHDTPVSVTVWWPDGSAQRWNELLPGRYYTLQRSIGIPPVGSPR